MRRQEALKPSIYTVVKQDFQRVGNPSSKRAMAICNTVTACSRDTPSKASRNSSRLSPPSKYSQRCAIGTRVPTKHGVPLIRSGSIEITRARGSDGGTYSVCVSGASIGGISVMLRVCGITSPFQKWQPQQDLYPRLTSYSTTMQMAHDAAMWQTGSETSSDMAHTTRSAENSYPGGKVSHYLCTSP